MHTNGSRNRDLRDITKGKRAPPRSEDRGKLCISAETRFGNASLKPADVFDEAGMGPLTFPTHDS